MDDTRDKVIAAFKGLMTNCKLCPLGEGLRRSGHTWSGLMIGGEFYDVVCRRRDFDRLVDLLDRLFSAQIGQQCVSDCLQEIVSEWIEKGHDDKNQEQLESAAEAFLTRVEEELYEFLVFVPIEGLKFNSSSALKVARCLLYRNYDASRVMELVQCPEDARLCKSYERITEAHEQASAFFKVALSGHFERVAERAREEAELSLNVLRLLTGSYYHNIHKRSSIPRFMGIVGTRPRLGAHNSVLCVRVDQPAKWRRPGSSEQYQHPESVELERERLERLKNDFLPRINQLIGSPESRAKHEIARRLLRVVNWFGKASTASTIAESFLMYAISIESLLSEGRTRKETYAKRIAALVTCDERFSPKRYLLSSHFAEALHGSSTRSERFTVVYERVRRLFLRRNHVAHGRVLEDQIEVVDLVDLEVLVRNSILSFLDGGWDTLEQFKSWLDTQPLPDGDTDSNESYCVG